MCLCEREIRPFRCRKACSVGRQGARAEPDVTPVGNTYVAIACSLAVNRTDRDVHMSLHGQGTPPLGPSLPQMRHVVNGKGESAPRQSVLLRAGTCVRVMQEVFSGREWWLEWKGFKEPPAPTFPEDLL